MKTPSANAQIAGSFGAASLLAAACALTTSFDGLTGASTSPPDAPLDGSTKSPADADADRPPIAVDGAAMAGGFCGALSPAPTFCDDFDHAGFAGIWDVITTDNGAVTQDTKYAVSPPSSALFSVNAVGSATPVDVSINRSFASLAGVAMDATLSFQMRFDTIDKSSPPASSVVCAIDLVDASGKLYEVQLAAKYDGSGGVKLTIAEMAMATDGTTSGYSEKSAGRSIPLATWAALQLVYHVTTPSGGADNAVEFLIDGAKQTSIAAPSGIVNGTPRIILGTEYVTSGSAPWAFRADNLTFTAVRLP